MRVYAEDERMSESGDHMRPFHFPKENTLPVRSEELCSSTNELCLLRFIDGRNFLHCIKRGGAERIRGFDRVSVRALGTNNPMHSECGCVPAPTREDSFNVCNDGLRGRS